MNFRVTIGEGKGTSAIMVGSWHINEAGLADTCWHFHGETGIIDTIRVFVQQYK